jgi:hypothetical protein
VSTSAYAAWIRGYVEGCNGAVLGRCREACAEMSAAFPELRTVRGHVIDALWGQRGHIWLETAYGTIVDPTASQFPFLAEYLHWEPGGEVRVGRCMHCGAHIWRAVESLDVDPGQERFCDAACADEAANALNEECRMGGVA